MVRVTTSNYGADATTQFAWATTDDDLFDREDDLYNLSQAVEFHDHTPTRGLPIGVDGIGANAVDEAAIAALAVTESKLGTGAVTNGKLGAGAVTRDKITWPLVQASDNMAGGFRQRETTNTYALGFYVAANGLAVLGAGTVAAVGTNLILGQAGQVSVGTVQGAGKFNVIQTATTYGSGIKIYHSNQVNYIDIYSDVNNRMVFGAMGNPWAHFTAATGFLTLGAAASDAARLHLVQTSQAAAQGIYITWGAGFGQMFVLDTGALEVRSNTTGTLWRHDVAAFTALNSGTTNLGHSDTRWLTIYGVNLDLSGTITVAGGTGGLVPLNGIVIFRTAAERTAAGASWAAYTDADGRILVGAGTTFSQTFTEATNYGSNWTPLAGVNTAVPDDASVLAGNTSGANTALFINHDHAIPATTWLPPMRAVVYGRRNS